MDSMQTKLRMLWAAFTLCFFCFMRSGELGVGGDGNFDPSRDLKLKDIAIDDIQNLQSLTMLTWLVQRA